MSAQILKDKLSDILTRFQALSLVYLFGSHAAGTAGPTSDYDLGILVDRDADQERIRAEFSHELACALNTDRIDATGSRNKSPILVAIGGVSLLVGFGVAFLGPVEMYCFYLFSEGGRFHYPGFGFGSFMFGNIAAQIAGYYGIAAVLIPFGYGHLARRRWIRPLALTLIGCWLVLGIPLGILFILVLLASKDVSIAGAFAAISLVGAAYLVLPWLLLRFYRSRDVRLTLESRDPNPHWLERRPIPVLVLVLLYVFYGIVLHIPILFNGLLPLFGRFLTGLPGIVGLDLAILLLALLTWGTFQQKRWAWWGSLIYWGAMALSVILTFVSTGYPELLDIANFPARELEFLNGIPLHGYHLALFFGLPLLATLGVIAASKRHFAGDDTSMA